jgi:tetratricopeptide (TPR) repeat protein
MSTRMYGLMVQIVRSMPDEDSRARCSSAVRCREHALAALTRGDFAQAIERAEQGLGLVPTVAAAEPVKGLLYGVKAMALVQTGRYSESIDAGAEAIKYLEGHSSFLDDLATTLNAYGGALLASGNASASVATFERAISLWRTIPGSAAKISGCSDNLCLAKAGRVGHRASARDRPWWKFW